MIESLEERMQEARLTRVDLAELLGLESDHAKYIMKTNGAHLSPEALQSIQLMINMALFPERKKVFEEIVGKYYPLPFFAETMETLVNIGRSIASFREVSSPLSQSGAFPLSVQEKLVALECCVQEALKACMKLRGFWLGNIGSILEADLVCSKDQQVAS